MPAPIQIKRNDIVQDVRALAALTGQSITDAIGLAVRTELERRRAERQAFIETRRAAALETLNDLWQLPVAGPTLTDWDLYDENGLPK